MKDQERIESEVRQTLDVLDHMRRVEGNPYLFTRLQAQMANGDRTATRQSAPGWQLALTMLIIVLNGAFLFQYWQGNRQSGSLPQALSAEWGLDQNASAYFITQIEQ
ncbi:MAG: hypothetical protein EP344_00415 [Bacteroidetes bacterium]|nr:MAG: hypothetical protein EP344_00415 [Bacteroidota bacterium]